MERVADSRENQMYTSQPQIRLHNTEFSENESNLSEDECKSLNASQSNIRKYLLMDLNFEEITRFLIEPSFILDSFVISIKILK